MPFLPRPLQKLLLILLCCTLLLSGCAATGTPYEKVSRDGSAGMTQADDHAGHAHQGYQQTGRGGERAALWILAGFLIATVVVVDLFILPWTHHDPFPCCRAVVHICH